MLAYIRIKGPQDAVCSLPTLVNTHLTMPFSCTSDPCVHSLPKYAKRIKPPMKMGVDAGPDTWEAEYGVAWTPQSFVEEAAGKSHPGHFMDGAHPVLKGFCHGGKNNPGSNNAKHRTEQMRKWILRAQELKCASVCSTPERKRPSFLNLRHWQSWLGACSCFLPKP